MEAFFYGFMYSLGLFDVLQMIILAVVGSMIARNDKKHDKYNKKAEERALARQEESRLSMQMMSANNRLAVATGIAIKENRINGEMDAALAAAEAASNEYFKFINRTASTIIGKC